MMKSVSRSSTLQSVPIPESQSHNVDFKAIFCLFQMKNFKGNKDGHSVSVNWLTQPLGAVFLRIIPVHWKSTPYLRVDLYGCQRGILIDLYNHIIRFSIDMLDEL